MVKFFVIPVVGALCAASLSGCGGSSASLPLTGTGGGSGTITTAATCYTQTASNRKMWYVSAAAATNGSGTRTSPFNSLSAVQAASGPGDAITILASPTTTAPLNGGITLKQGQLLIGDGPAVLSSGAPAMTGGLPLVGAASGLTAVPAITNTTTAANNGDAVDLASNASVVNIVIAGSARGGIYGSNASNVCLQGNDISGNNTSQTVGFSVLPFYLEQYAAGQAKHDTLAAGWASILIDNSAGSVSTAVDGNYVHDGSCSDGIDVRAMGTSNATATINGNFVTRMPQCAVMHCIQAIGIQASATGVLTATLTGNTEENNGSAGADPEGLFVNEGDSGQVTANVSYNYFNTNIGGASSNGLEFIVGDGNGETGNVTINNSTFTNDPGDMLEEFNRGTNATTTLTLNNVTVNGTTISGGLPTYANPAGTAASPDNTGECFGSGSVGAGNSTIFKMNNSSFTNCGNNGIEVTNNHATAMGAGSPALVSIDLENSSITNVKYYGVWMNTVTPLQAFNFKAQNSQISTTSSGSALLAFDVQSTGTVGTQSIDLGGGTLGSTGGNCITNPASGNIEATSYNVTANSDWWGSAAGPAPSTIVVGPAGYTASVATPLSAAPTSCTSGT